MYSSTEHTALMYTRIPRYIVKITRLKAGLLPAFGLGIKNAVFKGSV